MYNSKCPYCAYLFTKVPQRKTKCPNCSNYVYSKRYPWQKEPHLVQEYEVDIVSRAWEEHYRELQWISDLEMIGITKKHYDEIKELLSTNDKQPSSDSIAEYILKSGIVVYNEDLFYKGLTFESKNKMLRIMGLPEITLNDQWLYYTKRKLYGYIRAGLIEFYTNTYECKCNPENKESMNGKTYNIMQFLNFPSLPCEGCDAPDCMVYMKD